MAHLLNRETTQESGSFSSFQVIMATRETVIPNITIAAPKAAL